MTKNRHRWKAWIEDESVAALLDDLAPALKWSWKRDQRSPESFPVNTYWIFIQSEDKLNNKPILPTSNVVLRPPRIPKKVSDLVPEHTVKSVYEDQNEGSYEEALKLAQRGYDEGFAAWRKIWRALDRAYLIGRYGLDAAPMPRVHFLHRRLLEITASEHLEGLSLPGMVEFFDDVCPCGKKHKADALRKLKKRTANLSHAASAGTDYE